MLQKPILTLGTVALLLFGAVLATQAAEFGTREEANAMLDARPLVRGIVALS